MLKAGRTPGTVEVGLDVDDQLPLHGNVELSNRNSPYTVPMRLGASAALRQPLAARPQRQPDGADRRRRPASSRATCRRPTCMPVGSGGEALAPTACIAPATCRAIRPACSAIPTSTACAMRAAADGARLVQSLSRASTTSDVKQSLQLGGRRPDDATPELNYTPLVATYNGTVLGQGSSTAVNATSPPACAACSAATTAFAAKRYGASADFVSLRGGVQQTETFARWTVSGKLELQVGLGPVGAQRTIRRRRRRERARLPGERTARRRGGAPGAGSRARRRSLGDSALRLDRHRLLRGRAPAHAATDLPAAATSSWHAASASACA